jgi:hydroxypyruvate reductase
MVAVMEAALEAVDPAEAVRRHLRREGSTLYVGDRSYDLQRYARVYVVGGGKAGAPMSQAVEQVLGERITAGRVNVKYGYALPTETIELTEAAHPIPDEAGVHGSREVARLLSQAGEDDLVLCLISGGGSALMSLPVEGIALQDMSVFTDALLRRGATINEINALRKHLEQLKGGRLAQLAHPATVASLILSDVVGNPLDVIASGPAVPDSSSFGDAWELLQRYDLVDDAPAAVVRHLEKGSKGEVPETPKEGDPVFERTHNVIVASNDIAARAAQRAAQQEGFSTLLLSTYVEGEAREVAKVFAAIAKEVVASGTPLEPPACVIAGGETTVTVTGQGSGGRNQEMALAAALQIDGLDDVAMACLATDGTDGPTDASGAVADGTTLRRAREQGLDPWEHLERNDSYPFFQALDDLLLTGPTNTNVNDLAFVFVW